MRWTLLTSLLTPVALLAGCGNSRTPVPSVSSAPQPGGFQALRYPTEGLSLVAPRAWTVKPGLSPLVATIASASSVVAIWRYHRTLPPPRSPGALRRAQRLLIRDARRRDPTLELIRSTIAVLDGAPAIEIDAIEKVAGQPRRVRSTHVFERRAEVVLEEYAPPQSFRSVDRIVFSPVKRSLQLSRATAA